MRTALPRTTDRIDLGPYRVSPICVGLVGDPAVIPAAFEAGINFFFVTCDMHWPLYDGIRRGLQDLLATPGRRDQIVVAGVSYVTQPEFCRMPFRELIESLPGLERLDVLVAGGAYGHEIDVRLPIYHRHREESRYGARAVGASFHDRASCAEQLRRGRVDVAFARYNAGHPGARQDLFPVLPAGHAPLYNFTSTRGWVTPARAHELGLSDDFWFPGPADHYRFALTRPEVDGLLVAPRVRSHLDELLAALAEGPLDEEDQDHLIYLAELAGGTHELVQEDPGKE